MEFTRDDVINTAIDMVVLGDRVSQEVYTIEDCLDAEQVKQAQADLKGYRRELEELKGYAEEHGKLQEVYAEVKAQGGLMHHIK